MARFTVSLAELKIIDAQKKRKKTKLETSLNGVGQNPAGKSVKFAFYNKTLKYYLLLDTSPSNQKMLYATTFLYFVADTQTQPCITANPHNAQCLFN